MYNKSDISKFVIVSLLCNCAMSYPRSIPLRIHHKQAAFTLIEVLVVLIIVGMLSGVLFQALERAYRLQERFGTELFKVQQGQMATDWYRQSIQGLQPDYPNGNHLFRGSAQEIFALSSNPLNDDYGAPTAIQWKIKRNQPNNSNELIYIDQQRETTLLSWRGKQARFIYLDEQLTLHESWPPPLGKFPQLPQQIQLEADDQGEHISIVASVLGPSTPLIRAQDAFGL